MSEIAMLCSKIKRYYKLNRDQKNYDVYMNIEKIKKSLSDYKYVSFDIFDTLIKRDVQVPSDVFDIVEREYNQSHVTPIYGFKKLRVQAEKTARKNSKDEEVDLEMIYQNISFNSKNEKEDLKTLEEKIEYALCTPHKPVLEIYKYCIEQGKKVYLTSDMYLDEALVIDILHKCGISKYETLYLSNKYKKTKRTGSLFECLLAQEKINAMELIHIGDSKYADDKIPRIKGIETILIPRMPIYDFRCVPRWKDTLNINLINSFINNHIDIGTDDFYKFGFDSLGVLLWGFSKWLNNELKKSQILNVYFFSRDGWIMKKAFDIVNSMDSGISSFYIEVSRRSLKVPLLWKDCTLKRVVQNISAVSMIKISSLFEGMGLDVNNYSGIIKKFGFDSNTEFERSNILKNNRVIHLFEVIKEDVYVNSKREYENVKKYLIEKNISGKIAIVDIGWSGSMQRNLMEIFQSMHMDVQITGYYMGVTRDDRNQIKQDEMNMKGYIFDCVNDSFAIEKHHGFVGLFETFFLERKGSVHKYEYDKQLKKMVAIRYPYEYIHNGKNLPEIYKIEKLQKGALKFISTVESSQYLKYIELPSADAFENLRHYCGSPTPKELDMFADFHFYDEDITTYLAKPNHNLIGYIFHIKQLKSDLHFSGWKIGFLRILLRVNLPYYRIKQIKDRMLNG